MRHMAGDQITAVQSTTNAHPWHMRAHKPTCWKKIRKIIKIKQAVWHRSRWAYKEVFEKQYSTRQMSCFFHFGPWCMNTERHQVCGWETPTSLTTKCICDVICSMFKYFLGLCFHNITLFVWAAWHVNLWHHWNEFSVLNNERRETLFVQFNWVLIEQKLPTSASITAKLSYKYNSVKPWWQKQNGVSDRTRR